MKRKKARKYINSIADDVKDALGLHAWHIDFYYRPCSESEDAGDGWSFETKGTVKIDASRMKATVILYVAGIENETELFEHFMHEMCHIVLASEVVLSDLVLSMLPEHHRPAYLQALEYAREQGVVALARVLRNWDPSLLVGDSFFRRLEKEKAK